MRDNEIFWGTMAVWAALATLAIPIIFLTGDRDVLLGVFTMVFVVGNISAFCFWTIGKKESREKAEDSQAEDQNVILMMTARQKDNDHPC